LVAAEGNEVFIHCEYDIGPNVRRFFVNKVYQFVDACPTGQRLPGYEHKGKDLIKMIANRIDLLAGRIVDGHALR